MSIGKWYVAFGRYAIGKHGRSFFCSLKPKNFVSKTHEHYKYFIVWLGVYICKTEKKWGNHENTSRSYS